MQHILKLLRKEEAETDNRLRDVRKAIHLLSFDRPVWKKRVLSVAARKKIADAQRQRWARWKAKRAA